MTFISANALSGPPMQLAVLRKQVRELPFDFSLDESMAMQPGEQRGDLGPITTQGSTGTQLLIDSVVTDAR
jgi:hypothetical protein